MAVSADIRHEVGEWAPDELQQMPKAAQILHHFLQCEKIELAADGREETPDILRAPGYRAELPDVERPEHHRPLLATRPAESHPVSVQRLAYGTPCLVGELW